MRIGTAARARSRSNYLARSPGSIAQAKCGFSAMPGAPAGGRMGAWNLDEQIVWRR